MAGPVGALFVDLSLNSAAFVADTGKARRALSSGTANMNRSLATLDKGFGRMRRSMGRSVSSIFSMRGAIATLAGGAGIGLLVKTTIKAASDVEEMQSKFAAVFQAAAGDAEKWADTHGKAVNRSKFALMGYLATFQDTFVPLGFARKEAAGFAKTLTELAVDLASFNNAAEPETIQLLTSALVGNHEAVRKFGILITEASLKAELLRSGMAKTTSQATELQKVQARLNIIMNSSADAQGDAARTADQFANLTRGLDAAWNDLSVTIGDKFMPVARDSVILMTRWARAANDLAIETQAELMAFLAREIASVRAELASAPDELEVFGVGLSASAGTAQALAGELLILEARLRAVRAAAEKGVSLDAFGGPGPAGPTAPKALTGPAFDKKQSALLFPEGTDAGIKAATRATIEFTKAENVAFFKIEDSTAAMRRQAAQTSRLMNATILGESAVKEVTASIELENQALLLGVDRTTQQGIAWEAAFAKTQQMESGLADIKKAQDAANDSMQTFADIGVRALDDMAGGYTDLKSIAVSALRDILNETLRLARAQKSTPAGGGQSIFSALAGAALGIFGGGGGAAAQVAGDFAGQAAFSTPFAHGGKHRGGLRLVGEQGPELEATGPSRIFSAAQTKDILSGGGRGGAPTIIVNNNIDARGAEIGVEERIDAVLSLRTPAIVAEAVKESRKNVEFLANSGGQFAKAMGRR